MTTLNVEEARNQNWTIGCSGRAFFDIEMGLNDIDYYENGGDRTRKVQIPDESVADDKQIFGTFQVECYSAAEAVFVANALMVRLDGPVEGENNLWQFESE